MSNLFDDLKQGLEEAIAYEQAFSDLQPQREIMKILQTYRLSNNLTQEQFAEKSGITLSDIKMLESAAGDPSLDLLKRLADSMEEKLCRMGTLREPMPVKDFVAFVSRTLGSNGVRYAGTGNEVRRVAVGGGSCGNSQDAVIAAGCDTFVTSDLGYHDFLDAASKGLNLIDAGHFPTEDVVCKEVISYLTARFPELSIEKSTSHREVIQYYVEGDL